MIKGKQIVASFQVFASVLGFYVLVYLGSAGRAEPFELPKAKLPKAQLPNAQCSNVRMSKCPNIQMITCPNVRMSKCPNVQMSKCSNVQIFKRPNEITEPTKIKPNKNETEHDFSVPQMSVGSGNEAKIKLRAK